MDLKLCDGKTKRAGKCRIRSARYQKCLGYALNRIWESPLSPYVDDVVLFGSCARGQEKHASDVDLLVELDPDVASLPKYKREARLLRSDVSTDDINDPETDLKVFIGDAWRGDRHLHCKNIRKDGVSIWQKNTG